jgi:lysophospholipase L1-like esterase
MLRLATKSVLFPLLLAQALRVRAVALRLPEASGERQGHVGSGQNPLRLLIVGDSSAAGVGVEQQHDALAAQTAQHLAQLTGRAVDWRLIAQTGLDCRQALGYASSHAIWPCDIAVVVLGVNDVTGQLSLARCLAHRRQLAQWLQANTGAAHIVFTSLPPMDRFTLLPQPLRSILASDARRLDAAVRRMAEQSAHMSWSALPDMQDPRAIASDGFHPGALAYAAWAQQLASHIADRRITERLADAVRDLAADNAQAFGVPQN